MNGSGEPAHPLYLPGDLQPIMKPGNHLLKLREGKIGHIRVASFGREERNRVVPPVVGQPLVKQIAIVEEGVDREELNRSHAEFAEVVHHCGVG